MTEPTPQEQLQASLGTAYTIERELGGGGMSRVYLARDEALGRDVVIKVLPRELAAEMSAERFTREIKLAAALQHPHVLPVLSAGVSNGLPYYMMPYVRGESLRTAIDGQTMSRDESLDILRDVARALRYAQRKTRLGNQAETSFSPRQRCCRDFELRKRFRITYSGAGRDSPLVVHSVGIG